MFRGIRYVPVQAVRSSLKRLLRYNGALLLALLLEPVIADAQAVKDDRPSRNGSSGPAAEAGAPGAPGVEESAAGEHSPPSPVAGAPEPGDGDRREDTGKRAGRRMPKHVALRLRAISRNLVALSDRGSTAITGGLFSLALGGASIVLGALVDDPSLPTYLYVFGSIHAARGISGMILVPDPTAPALRFSQMPMASVSDVKRRLRFGSFTLKRLADRNRWARLVDGTLLVGAGLLAVPLLLIRDDFGFDTALDYFVVAGAGVSLLVGVATLLMPTEAEKRYDSYRDFRRRMKLKWQKSRRGSEAAPRVRAALCPTRGGAAVLIRVAF